MLRKTRIRELEDCVARQGRIITRLTSERDKAQADADLWQVRAHRPVPERVTVPRDDVAEMAVLTKERDEAIARCLKQERIIAELQSTNEAHYRELSERAGMFAADATVDAE